MSSIQGIKSLVEAHGIKPSLVKAYICDFEGFEPCKSLPAAPSHFPTLVDTSGKTITCLDSRTLKETSSPAPTSDIRSRCDSPPLFLGNWAGKRPPRMTRSARLAFNDVSSPQSVESQLFDQSYSYTQDTSGMEPSLQKQSQQSHQFSDYLLDSDVGGTGL